MKKVIFLILSLFIYTTLVTSCKQPKREKKASSLRPAKGKRTYGGTLHINQLDKVQTLYPEAITDVTSFLVASQIYEGLVKFNPKDLAIMPAIARSWNIDSSGTVYTFHLRKNVHFQDNPCFPKGKGRLVTAKDVQYSFEQLCTASKNNFNFAATFKDKVVGADKYYEESKSGKPDSSIAGVSILNDSTVQIRLIQPTSSFLYSLASPGAYIVPKEAIDKYGMSTTVGTGPFVYNSNMSSKDLILTRNPNYYRVDSFGNQLPYLDSVDISFIPKKTDELKAFMDGKLDVITGLPSQNVRQIVENQITAFQHKPPKYILGRIPEMITEYYEFNLTKPPFNNLKVRQAFNYAIDRDKIIDEVLRGEAYGPGVNGITPPAFKGYDVSKIKGYDYEPDKARKLLADAGYPDGKGFPNVKVELNAGGAKNTNVVIEIQKELKQVLNVNIDFDVVPFAQKLEDEKYARGDIFRSGWVADYPSPEDFLWLLYGKTVPDSLDKPSFPNAPRYVNPQYDKLFEEGEHARTIKESYKYFMQAEQLMVKDAPIMVLWYDENYRLTQAHVKNLYANPMRYRDYSEVYLQAK